MVLFLSLQFYGMGVEGWDWVVLVDALVACSMSVAPTFVLTTLACLPCSKKHGSCGLGAHGFATYFGIRGRAQNVAPEEELRCGQGIPRSWGNGATRNGEALSEP